MEIDPRFLRALMYPLAASDVGMATLVSTILPSLAEDAAKVAVNWNPDRVVYVMPDAKVGRLLFKKVRGEEEHHQNRKSS